ncbi:MAG: XRE family transcriptional regulator [Bacillota bacterium]|nr:XRE family transcriptional regulator [Bacillota bacterium]
METRIVEIAERIKGLRELMEYSPETMAKATGLTVDEYLEFESGNLDFNFTFLYNCADKLGVDIVEILTGEQPRLSSYSIVRKGEGLNIKRREGFKYEHMNYRFKNKSAEAFIVTAPSVPNDSPIVLSTHEGQEFDYVLSGTLKFALENHVEVLNEGDAVYYNSGRGHGMIAIGGSDCKFLAVTLHKGKEAD